MGVRKLILRNTCAFALIPVLGACTNLIETQDTESQPMVPEEVIAIADPGQDVMSAFLRPEDNCYWYMHNGPVEITPLPLKTVNGQRICVEVSDA